MILNKEKKKQFPTFFRTKIVYIPNFYSIKISK